MTQDLATWLFLILLFMELERIAGQLRKDRSMISAGVQQLRAPWTSCTEKSYICLHPDQDSTGDMPEPVRVVRFGPEEPRWWMQYVRGR
jgi:hypothetical protein